MKFVERGVYMDFLMRNRERHIIKVLTGVRRCGKSTMFSMFQQRLADEGIPAERIHVVNFEDIAFESLLEYHALYDYILKRLVKGAFNYVFLDEIQHVPQFERAVDSLFIKENVDLYITGSNAYLMSGDLATLLSGRFIELKMLPLSFGEFCSKEREGRYTVRELYEKYTTESAFPYALRLDGNEHDINEYLRGIYSTILLKDIVDRLRISDIKMLESITKYIFANIGSQLSARRIANAMVSAWRKIDGKTVERYIQGLEDGFLIYQADRFDIKGKELLRFNPKYYVVDMALRFLLVGRHGHDTGHILENVVYLELLRRGARVRVGAMPDGEVDFVAEDDDGIVYYQVSESTESPDVLRRELSPLQKIRDQYPKVLLTLDDINSEADYNGIRKQNVLKWLLQGR